VSPSLTNYLVSTATNGGALEVASAAYANGGTVGDLVELLLRTAGERREK